MNEELPISDGTQSENKSVSPEDKVSSFLNKEVSRREVLKIGAMSALAVFLASCAPDKVLEAAEKEINADDNVAVLNSQFSSRIQEFVNDKGIFDYERIFQNNPEFLEYKSNIDTYSQEIQRVYNIQPGVMKLLASSIMVANVGYQQDPTIKKENQRIGIMGIVPSNMLSIANEGIGNKNYTIEELQDPRISIYMAMTYMARTLKEIKNDGPNRDLMSLMLANYYGGKPLQDIAKGKLSIEQSEYLRDNYNLYMKALNSLGGVKNYTENIEISSKEYNGDMEGVWKHLTDSWQDSRFKEYKDVFFAEAEKYFKDTKSNNRLRLSKAQYLALFASMAMAESAGGKNLYNETSQAYGWYQIVKGTDHLDKYNGEFGTNYEYKDLLNNDKVSIDVGIWALMRYRNTIDELRDACPPYKKDPDWHVLLKFFKAGSLFTKNSDDTLWWNRITYATKKLLNHNYLSMEYLDYFMPIKGTSMWDGPYKASEFEDNLAHIGNIKVT